MSKGPTETTDRLFPPPENANPDAPIPLGVSVRTEFALHRVTIERQLHTFGSKLDEALERLSPSIPSPKATLLAGAGKGAKITGAVLAILGAADLIVGLVAPQYQGVTRSLLQLFGGG